jgi:hypothetical protein
MFQLLCLNSTQENKRKTEKKRKKNEEQEVVDKNQFFFSSGELRPTSNNTHNTSLVAETLAYELVQKE